MSRVCDDLGLGYDKAIKKVTLTEEGRIWDLNLNLKGAGPLHADVFHELDDVVFFGISYLEQPTLPHEIFSPMRDLKYLRLAKCDISHLHHGTFSALSHLVALEIRACKLSQLSARLLSGLPNLEHLVLANNSLTTVPKGLFDSSLSLEYIDLSGNRIGQLPDDLFDKLPKLYELNLSRNQLQQVKGDLYCSLPSLSNVSLQNNPDLPEYVQRHFYDFIRADWFSSSLVYRLNRRDGIKEVMELLEQLSGSGELTASNGELAAKVITSMVTKLTEAEREKAIAFIRLVT